MDRVYRPVRRECRRIRQCRGRGRAEAAYLAPGGGRCCGMDSGREASAFLFRARGLCGLRPPLHRSCRWRPGRYSAYVAGRTSVVFSRRNTDWLRAKLALADVLETLSRTANHANLYRAFERPGAGESAAREFE